jgi:hypothetical protein
MLRCKFRIRIEANTKKKKLNTKINDLILLEIYILNERKNRIIAINFRTPWR